MKSHLTKQFFVSFFIVSLFFQQVSRPVVPVIVAVPTAAPIVLPVVLKAAVVGSTVLGCAFSLVIPLFRKKNTCECCARPVAVPQQNHAVLELLSEPPIDISKNAPQHHKNINRAKLSADDHKHCLCGCGCEFTCGCACGCGCNRVDQNAPNQNRFIEPREEPKREKILPKVETYEQARNKALEIIGDVDPHTSMKHFGRIKDFKGLVVGRRWHRKK